MDGRRAHPTSSSRAPERRPHRGPAGLARIARFRGDHGRPHPRRRRGHSARPGASRSRRGQPTRSGTGFPSPTASNVPARTKMSPAAQDVPTRDNMSPNVRSAPTHAVGPDHEWGTHTDRPFAVPPATGTPPFPTTTGRPSAQTSCPAPQVRSRRSKRTGPSPMLAVWRRL